MKSILYYQGNLNYFVYLIQAIICRTESESRGTSN